MELILQTGLVHQEIPVRSVAEVLDGVPYAPPVHAWENPLFDLDPEVVSSAVKEIQKRNGIDDALRTKETGEKLPYLPLDLKMETGTGKTYVYTYLIYELHKRFGVNKFVVAVPSLAIKSGARTFLADEYVKKHFRDTLGYGSEIELCELSARKAKAKGRKYFPSRSTGSPVAPRTTGIGSTFSSSI